MASERTGAGAPEIEIQPAPRETAPASADAATLDVRESSSSVARIWETVKAHKVVQWTVAYAAFAYTLIHGVEMAGEAFAWPSVISQFTILALLLGVPVAAVLAWYHGHRAQHRITGSELSILTVLLVIAGTVLWKFSGTSREPLVPLQTVATFSPPAHSVAVLPFANLSGDPNQEYFSDGVSEELLNALSRIDALQVAARTSSFSFKRKDVDIGTIARKLNVATVLEGSVRRSGNTVRVTAQLVNAVNGFHLWSQTYDRELKDILAVQAEVATAVAQQLQVKLLGDQAAKIDVGGTHNPEAYDAYLRGVRLLAGQGNAAEGLVAAFTGNDSARTALAAFDEAIALDANYADAFASRATALLSISQLTADRAVRGSLRDQARQAAERAEALAPDLGEAHLALGDVRVAGLDFLDAALEYDRALSVAPGSARVQRNVAWFAGAMGHHDAALAAARRAVTLDPQNYYSHLALAQVLSVARRFDETLEAAAAARAVNPGGQEVLYLIGSTYLAIGQPEHALQVCSATRPPQHRCLALAYHALGKPREAEIELDELKAYTGNAAAFIYAGVYAQWGNRAQALQWLAVAEQSRDSNLQFLRAFWTLDPIRNEVSFKALERRLNFPP
jgi:TolB-like protein